MTPIFLSNSGNSIMLDFDADSSRISYQPRCRGGIWMEGGDGSARHDDSRYGRDIFFHRKRPSPGGNKSGWHTPHIRIVREIAPHSSTAYHDLLTQKLKNKDTSMDLFFMDVIWPAEFAAAG